MSFTCWIYLLAIDDESALETDTFCGNVKGPFWFAQLGEAMAGSLGQGSPVKRSSSVNVEVVSVQRLTIRQDVASYHTGPVIACCVCACFITSSIRQSALCELLAQNYKEGRRDVSVEA